MHLATLLSQENQDVVLIDRDSEHLADLDTRLNIMTREGNPVSPSDLREAGAGDCDLFVAVTPYEDINIISAQLAKRMGATRTVARIDNPEFTTPDMEEHFRSTGVDTMVYPEMLAARDIANFLRHNWARSRFELHEGALIVAAVRLDSHTAYQGVPLRELIHWRDWLHVCAIRRRGAIIIPDGDDCLMQGDIVHFSILQGHEEKLATLCGKENIRISSILIAGAGKLTATLLRELSDRYSITVIDSDRERCRKLMRLPYKFTIANSDQRDIKVLNEEGLGKVDAFMALNESSEKNIVGCMLSRQFGVKRVVGEIEDIQYFTEAENLEIDTVVNKKLMTASHIFQTLLDTVLDTPRCLALDDAEVMEIIAKEESPITRSPIHKMKIPKGITIAGLVREGRGMLVNGATQVIAGDHVVAFCLRGILSKMEHLFR